MPLALSFEFNSWIPAHRKLWNYWTILLALCIFQSGEYGFVYVDIGNGAIGGGSAVTEERRAGEQWSCYWGEESWGTVEQSSLVVESGFVCCCWGLRHYSWRYGSGRFSSEFELETLLPVSSGPDSHHRWWFALHIILIMLINLMMRWNMIWHGDGGGCGIWFLELNLHGTWAGSPVPSAHGQRRVYVGAMGVLIMCCCNHCSYVHSLVEQCVFNWFHNQDDQGSVWCLGWRCCGITVFSTSGSSMRALNDPWFIVG